MKAILIGSTGLTGNLILKEILNDNHFTEVRVFVRRPTGITNPRLIEIITPMYDIDVMSKEIRGDVLFNALGTTMRKAGSRAEQRRIDRDLPVAFARIASGNGVSLMVNISSVGASMNGNFYLRTKAEMERGTEEYFKMNVFHFRPGLLAGKRGEFRIAESLASVIMKAADPLLNGAFKKYRSMPVEKLARAMVCLSKSPGGNPHILYYSDIMRLI
ncbi:MAG TPA: hypothetical protein PLS58_01080 [Bacteroidales bacterium]|nr:hypothetical protein [Bacteroidales bacterium]